MALAVCIISCMEKLKFDILRGREFKKSIILITSTDFILARFSAINITLVTSSLQRGGTNHSKLITII